MTLQPAAQGAARVSVCMATYNGARYLPEQVTSILAELHPDDELVVVDDASTDDSVAVMEGIGDPRMRIVRAERNSGYVRTFERAIALATGDVVLLSDQDDVWPVGRRDVLVAAALASGAAASNLRLLDSGEPLRSPLNGRPWLLRADFDHRRIRNELAILAGDAPYFGCAMALRRDVLPLVLPFPEYLTESHDLWIATATNAAGVLSHVEQTTVLRRVHDDNASTSRPRGVVQALGSRLLLLRLWFLARRRIRSGRR